MSSSLPGLGITRLSGVAFALLFAAALTALLGDMVGAFADSAETFPPYFDSTADRLRHAFGAYVLAGSGLAFLGFVVGVSGLGDSSSAEARFARLSAAAFAAVAGVAAAALATVSLSIGFGRLTGDPGIRQGQELLPQLGYVLLTVPGALSAALAVWMTARACARTATLARPVVVLGYAAAAAQLVSFYTLPLALLPVWVMAASIGLRRPG